MGQTNWPPLIDALPLAEVAKLLEIPASHLPSLIAQGLIWVCTRKPLIAGEWVTFHMRDREEKQFMSRPFDGKGLARLSECDAAICLAEGIVTVTSVRDEPRHSGAYIEAQYVVFTGPQAGTPISVDDLLISRVEFEHFIRHYHPKQAHATQQAAERVTGQADAEPKPSHLLAIAGLLELLLDDSRPRYNQASAAKAIEARHPDWYGASASTLDKIFARANRAACDADSDAIAKDEARQAAADRRQKRGPAKG